MSIDITSTGIQVHGGIGFIEETGACQHMRDARITTIYEGTTGIQANDLIGRKVARDQGATVKLLLAEMNDTLAALEAAGDKELKVIAASLLGGTMALEKATEWLLATYDRDPASAAAGAVPYLKLFGTVAGGWLMARAALVADDEAGNARSRLLPGQEDHGALLCRARAAGGAGLSRGHRQRRRLGSRPGRNDVLSRAAVQATSAKGRQHRLQEYRKCKPSKTSQRRKF